MHQQHTQALTIPSQLIQATINMLHDLNGQVAAFLVHVTATARPDHIQQQLAFQFLKVFQEPKTETKTQAIKGNNSVPTQAKLGLRVN